MAAKRDGALFTRASKHLYFRDPDQDYYLQWALSFQKYGGAEFGECLAVCPRIKEGSPDSWAAEWLALSDRISKTADDCLVKGRTVSARDCYLRAYSYSRIGSIGLLPSEPAWPENYKKEVSYSQKAAALMDASVEPIVIPCRDGNMHGYLMRPDNGGTRRPTLIGLNGGESIAEDLYFWIGAPGLLRGY